MREYFPFPEPRENQLEVAAKIAKLFQTHQYVILNGPTGSGKSAIGITIANYFRHKLAGKSYLICSEKILQEQYKNDFEDSQDVAIFLGKNNYMCDREAVKVDDAICNLVLDYKDRYKLPCFAECSYNHVRRNAKKRSIVVSNYHKMLYEIDNLPEEIQVGTRSLAIFDECHNIENILLDYAHVGLSEETIKKIALKNSKVEEYFSTTIDNVMTLEALLTGMMKLNDDPEDVSECITYFNKVDNYYAALNEKFEKLLFSEYTNHFKNKVGNSEIADDYRLKSVRYLMNHNNMIKDLRSKISSMLKYIDTSKWIKEILKGEVNMKPVFCNYLFNDLLGTLAPKMLFMSATSPNKEILASTLNIDINQIAEVEMDNTFPVENRPVYVMDAINLNYDKISANLPEAVKIVDYLLDETKENTLIHTGNYKIASYIYANSKNKNIMIVPTSETRKEKVEEYKTRVLAGERLVLVSPSLMEGLSLDDNLCRVQIIVKVPYLSLGDVRTAIRNKLDPKWYSSNAAIDLMQSCGRGIRHKEDYCKTFILDQSFSKLLRYNRDLFHKWFLDSLVR